MLQRKFVQWGKDPDVSRSDTMIRRSCLEKFRHLPVELFGFKIEVIAEVKLVLSFFIIPVRYHPSRSFFGDKPDDVESFTPTHWRLTTGENFQVHVDMPVLTFKFCLQWMRVPRPRHCPLLHPSLDVFSSTWDEVTDTARSSLSQCWSPGALKRVRLRAAYRTFLYVRPSASYQTLAENSEEAFCFASTDFLGR